MPSAGGNDATAGGVFGKPAPGGRLAQLQQANSLGGDSLASDASLASPSTRPKRLASETGMLFLSKPPKDLDDASLFGEPSGQLGGGSTTDFGVDPSLPSRMAPLRRKNARNSIELSQAMLPRLEMELQGSGEVMQQQISTQQLAVRMGS